MTETISISVVIPTLGRSVLVRTVKSVLSVSEIDKIEVIVVGEIGDPEIAREIESIENAYHNVHHYRETWSEGDSSRKKNFGAAKARGSIIAFLDDDVTVAPDWAANIVKAFDDPKVGLVSGPGLVPQDVKLVGRLAGMALCSPAAGYVAGRYRAVAAMPREIEWSRIIGCNAAYRKNAFEAMGGFPPDFYPGEDMIAAWRVQRLGYKLMIIPAAWVLHYPRRSAGRFCRQMIEYGAVRVRLIRAGVPIEWTTLVPAFAIFTLVVFGILATWSLFFRWVLLGVGLCYALLVTFFAIVSAWQSGCRRDVCTMFMIPLMHACYGMGQWIEVIRPDKDFSRAATYGRDESSRRRCCPPTE